MTVDFIVGIMFTGIAMMAAYGFILVRDMTSTINRIDTTVCGLTADINYVKTIVDMPAVMHDQAHKDILLTGR